MEIIMDHAVCLEHAESTRNATEKFRAGAANPVPPRILRNSEPLQNFLREGAYTNFEMSRRRAYEIRMRAARKAGELSKKIEKASAARGNQYKEANPRNAEQAKGKVLERAGISTQQASEWERLFRGSAAIVSAQLHIESRRNRRGNF
jgi:hypothetical protein